LKSYPKISIITPSYNQGLFLEETILSVIGQNYPNLEYIIIDGGSTDNSVEIIKKYEKHLFYWVSEKDHGQSNAINKGFAKATGDIMGWINSDDYYLPGCFYYAATKMNPDALEILTGNCFQFYHDKPKAWGTDISKDHSKYDLCLFDYISQPSTFWTRKVWEKNGPLNENFHFVFDWELFIKAKKSNANFIITDKYISGYRFHNAHKTGTGGKKRYDEIIAIFRIYSGEPVAQLALKISKTLQAIPATRKKIKTLFLTRFEEILIRKRYHEIYNHDDNLIRNLRRMLGGGDSLY
jgi:glycosyltransferase involved in cell wall biosynthesis